MFESNILDKTSLSSSTLEYNVIFAILIDTHILPIAYTLRTSKVHRTRKVFLYFIWN